MRHRLYTFITTKPRGVFPTLFRIFLMPLSWLYGAVIWVRNCCYRYRIIKQRCLPCLVISIGNIVAGGTGKTPAAAAIAKLIQNSGLRVAVLLRGYKRQGGEPVVVVSDGENLLCCREECGDEAHMLARQIPDIPIIVGRQRFLTGTAALEHFKSDVLIVDDGFQHRQLTRDVDIIMIDATQPFGSGVLLPVGTMREPKSAIRRADIILLARTDAVNTDIADLKAALNRLAPNTPTCDSVHQPMLLYRINNQEDLSAKIPIETLTGKRLLAVCGIGNPDGFVSTLEKYNPEVVELLAFPDHHVYTEDDLQEIQYQMKQCQAEWVITTQKDEDKLSAFSAQIPILVLAVELVITEGKAALIEALQI